MGKKRKRSNVRKPDVACRNASEAIEQNGSKTEAVSYSSSGQIGAGSIESMMKLTSSVEKMFAELQSKTEQEANIKGRAYVETKNHEEDKRK